MSSGSRFAGLGGRRASTIVAGALTLVVVGVALYFGLRSSSAHHAAPATTSAAPASAPTLSPNMTQAQVIQAAVRNHDFIAPECPPVAGPHWVYPGASHFAGTLYEAYAIKYSCTTAASWIKRLATIKIPVSSSNSLVHVPGGPKGYSCGAWPDAHGHAYAGGCADTKTHSSFGWNWNIADPRHVFNVRANGTTYPTVVGGADSITTLALLHGKSYKLTLLNTSGVGFIHTFTWIPPTGWTVKSLSSVSGAKCKVDAGNLSCVGLVDPPTCLCAGDGGKVIVDLTIRGTNQGSTDGHPVYYGNEGETTELTSMIPLPFLIPGTHVIAHKQKSNE